MGVVGDWNGGGGANWLEESQVVTDFPALPGLWILVSV